MSTLICNRDVSTHAKYTFINMQIIINIYYQNSATENYSVQCLASYQLSLI